MAKYTREDMDTVMFVICVSKYIETDALFYTLQTKGCFKGYPFFERPYRTKISAETASLQYHKKQRVEKQQEQS